MTRPATLILIMGISGSGKTSLAEKLSACVGWEYLEADHFHSKAAVEKMRAGIALTDEDREPWISRLEQGLRQRSAAGESCILACSGLRRTHRARLTDTGFQSTRSFLLEADKTTLKQRLENRSDHYMPATLLDSQLEALEYPAPEENVQRLNTASEDTSSLVAQIIKSFPV